jgi:small subunit ribosomal protein S17
MSMTEATEKKSSQTHRGQTLKGTVVSDKMSKTCVIEVRRNIRHGLYQKNLTRRCRFFVHDERNEAKVGDVVLAVSIRPLSRHKSFKLAEILEKKVGA